MEPGGEQSPGHCLDDTDLAAFFSLLVVPENDALVVLLRKDPGRTGKLHHHGVMKWTGLRQPLRNYSSALTAQRSKCTGRLLTSSKELIAYNNLIQPSGLFSWFVLTQIMWSGPVHEVPSQTFYEWRCCSLMSSIGSPHSEIKLGNAGPSTYQTGVSAERVYIFSCQGGVNLAGWCECVSITLEIYHCLWSGWKELGQERQMGCFLCWSRKLNFDRIIQIIIIPFCSYISWD